MITLNSLTRFNIIVLLFCLFHAPAHAQDDPILLRVHHFLGPQSGTHADFLVPWTKKITEESQGRIQFEIYPSMTLGGKPPQLAKQARDGVVDIVWTLAGYTPGQFPRTEVFELPLIHQNNAIATNQAIWALYDEALGEDYQSLHPLAIHVHQGQSFHMRSKAINSIDDVRGLNIRTPSRIGGWFLEDIGANPVGMPVPDLPQSLAKGTVDGALIPFEVALPLRIHEIADYGIMGHNELRFGTAVFLLLMNEVRYTNLPDDLKAIIDRNSQDNLSLMLGQLWHDNEIKGIKAYQQMDKPVTILTEDAMQPFLEAAERTQKRWVDQLSENGLNGDDLIKKAQKALEARQ